MTRVGQGLRLGWNGQIGASYRVLAGTNPNPAGWADMSGTITATGTTAFWTATNLNSPPRRFYRITSP